MTETIVNDQFDGAFNTFMTGCQDISDVYMRASFPSLPRPNIDISPLTGREKFIRVTRADPDKSHMSSHCFVAKDDGSNRKLGAWKAGDVFKCDGWKSPAKGARGNIFDAKNGLGRMGQYGPEYNK